MRRMKFYTVQPRWIYKIWLRKGYIEALGNNFDFFDKPYAWMRARMAERKANYKGEPLLWMWVKRPTDYRAWSGDNRKKMVLLELEVDEQEVLMSDFDAWHMVLNNCGFEGGEPYERVFDLAWVRENFLEEHEEQIIQGVVGKIPLTAVRKVKYFTGKKELI